MRRPDLAAVFAGGMLGALARAALVEAAPSAPGTWPWVTFAVNLAGAFLLGAVAASDRWRPLVGTGFCGALTTFSTMQLELVRMDAGLAVAYAAASVAAGLAAAAAGLRVGRA